MKTRSLICILIISLMAACVPAAASRPTDMPAVGMPTAVPETLTALRPAATADLAAATPEPAVTKKPKGKATAKPADAGAPTTAAKPKGKNPAAAPTATSMDFIATPILGCPTATSVTANVVLAVSMEIYYEYGVASGAYSAQTAPQSAVAGSPLETLIGGLQPNTLYYYRLHYGTAVGPEHTFVTQRAVGSTFTFDIQGDSHPERLNKQFDPDLYTRTLLGAASDQPDFYMAIGDDFSVDQLTTVNADIVRSLYINQRQWLGLVGAPVFLVNGNHEQASLANLDSTANNVAVWAQTARNAYYPEPAPDAFYSGDAEPVAFIGQLRDYYAFTWGDALFVVIDPYWHSPQTVDNQYGAGHDNKGQRGLWNNTLGEAQYQWFKQTLETSTAKYKFVFTHHVNGTGRGGIELANTYEWGEAANLAAHRPGWTKTIQQLMADNHVTIFFQGHDHIFVHQTLDGVIYQTLPEPANPFYTYENNDAYQSGDKFPNSGRVRVMVSPEGVKVDYVRSYLDKPDELAFSYTVK
jgi:hypothetical protein